VKCPHCGKTASAESISKNNNRCPSCDKPFDWLMVTLRRMSWVQLVKNLIPLWILIAINLITYIIFLQSREPSYGGPMNPADMGAVVLLLGFIIFDVIYLIVWAILARSK